MVSLGFPSFFVWELRWCSNLALNILPKFCVRWHLQSNLIDLASLNRQSAHILCDLAYYFANGHQYVQEIAVSTLGFSYHIMLFRCIWGDLLSLIGSMSPHSKCIAFGNLIIFFLVIMWLSSSLHSMNFAKRLCSYECWKRDSIDNLCFFPDSLSIPASHRWGWMLTLSRSILTTQFIGSKCSLFPMKSLGLEWSNLRKESRPRNFIPFYSRAGYIRLRGRSHYSIGGLNWKQFGV